MECECVNKIGICELSGCTCPYEAIPRKKKTEHSEVPEEKKVKP